MLNKEFITKTSKKNILPMEMKYGVSSKAYLRAILNLVDKSIVSFVIGNSNNNVLIFEIFYTAYKQHTNAKSIFHSVQVYQYISKVSKEKLVSAKIS